MEIQYNGPEYIDALARHLEKTQYLLDLVNEKTGFHTHLSEEPVDLQEPFGAILWRRRTSMDYPLCIAADMCEIDILDMIKMEMGWAMPQENYDHVMETLLVIYGFMPDVWVQIRQRGLDYQNEKPLDLSCYLGIDLPAYFNAYRPVKIYGKNNNPLSYIRHSIHVVAQRFSNGKELPRQVIWTDGRVFPVDRIDAAQEAARLKTGGIGTRFSCWFKGRQRNICYQTQGKWFVETPCFA